MSDTVVGGAGSGSLDCLQSKVRKFWGGSVAADGRCAHPEFVLLQAEGVEQRRKLDVELARPDNTSEHRSGYRYALFTSDTECE